MNNTCNCTAPAIVEGIVTCQECGKYLPQFIADMAGISYRNPEPPPPDTDAAMLRELTRTLDVLTDTFTADDKTIGAVLAAIERLCATAGMPASTNAPPELISDEALETATDLLADEIADCDVRDKEREDLLEEARQFLWKRHSSQRSL